jgi:hypothetical protein
MSVDADLQPNLDSFYLADPGGWVWVVESRARVFRTPCGRLETMNEAEWVQGCIAVRNDYVMVARRANYEVLTCRFDEERKCWYDVEVDAGAGRRGLPPLMRSVVARTAAP